MTDPVAYATDEGIPVTMPSGGVFPVLNTDEAEYLTDRVQRYMADNHFVNVSDLQDVDRMLVMEVLCFRWGNWLSRQRDYFGDPVDENSLRRSLNDYCVDTETEALTKRGWCREADLVAGDQILTLNTATGLSEWQPILAVTRFDAWPREMRVLKTRWHSSLTTAGHRWWVKRGRHDRWVMTGEVGQSDRIPIAAHHAEFPVLAKYSDAFIELVAWWWTEGSCLRPAMSNGEVAQSHRVNPMAVSRIRGALRQEFGPPGPMKRGVRTQPGPRWNETRSEDRGMTFFNLCVEITTMLEAAAPNQQVDPSFLIDLTAAQLGLFIDVSVRADGSVKRYIGNGENRLSRQVYQAREANLRAFEVACALAGIATSTHHDGDRWVTSLMAKTAIAPALAEHSRGEDPQWVRYDGVVWCPTVTNGTWLARREGTVFYTGNSSELRQLKKILGIDKAARDRLKGDDSVPVYLQNLLSRAKEFGINRNKMSAKAIELVMQLQALVTLYDNSDDLDRREQHVTQDEIFGWIRDTLIPEFKEIDAAFRAGQQKTWVKSL